MLLMPRFSSHVPSQNARLRMATGTYLHTTALQIAFTMVVPQYCERHLLIVSAMLYVPRLEGACNHGLELSPLCIVTE